MFQNTYDGITILTNPFRRRVFSILDVGRYAKNILYSVVRGRRLANGAHSVGGPSSVLRSLTNGLDELGIDYNLNPPKTEVRRKCIVLSNVEALHEAIKLKNSGIIQTLLAGPNIVTLSDDHDGIILHPLIDLCIVPSDWVKELYLENSQALSSRISVWAAGVDLSMWPENRDLDFEDPTVVIYLKYCDDQFLRKKIHDYFVSSNWRVQTVIYGEYNSEQFAEMLSGASLAVFLSITESQGIALAEVWASNIPTLVLRRDVVVFPNGYQFPASSAPYLNESNGMFFNSFEVFIRCMEQFKLGSGALKPREWVSQNMTDEICAEKLIGLFNDAS